MAGLGGVALFHGGLLAMSLRGWAVPVLAVLAPRDLPPADDDDPAPPPGEDASRRQTAAPADQRVSPNPEAGRATDSQA